MELLVLLSFFVGFFVSILSGIGGGGGGFVIIPYYLLLGFNPAQALATAKFAGIGAAVGSILAFKGQGLVRKQLVVPLMAITFLCALVAAWLIPQVDQGAFQKIVGVVVLAMIPTLFINKAAFQPGERSRPWIIVGFLVFTLFSFLQSFIGTGIGLLVTMVLMFGFGLSALEANATKRVSQSVQAVLIFGILALQGFVMWAHGIAGMLGAILGARVGTKLAIKKGNEFVKFVMAGAMAVSGVVLLTL